MSAKLNIKSTGGGSVSLQVDDTLATDEIVIVQDPIGVNQTWQNMTASRIFGTDYTNDTGRPIYVSIDFGTANATEVNTSLRIQIDGLTITEPRLLINQYSTLVAYLIVPAGSIYNATGIQGVATLDLWRELR